MQRVGDSMKRTGDQMQKMGKTMSTYLTAPLVGFAGASAHLWDVQEQAIAQVEQGLKSTGNTAGKTLDQLKELASQMQDKSLYGDEAILKDVTAQLLTFTNIASDQFDRTQQAALDLSTRLGGDLKSASIQLGKALNDPIANLSALSRSGIQFTDGQKELIKSLWEGGDAAQAQSVILAELEKQYGGSAEAAAKAGLGPLKQLKNSIGDLMEMFGEIIGKAILPFVEHVKQGVKWLQALSPEIKEKIVLFGGLAAAIGPALVAIGTLTKLMGSLAIAGAGVSAPILGIAAAVAAAAALIVANWEPIKEYFTTGEGSQMWSTFRDAAEQAWQSLQVAFKVTVAFLQNLWDRFGNDFMKLSSFMMSTTVKTITSGLQIIADLFSALSFLLQGDWGNMWASLGNVFIGFYNWVVEMAGKLAQVIIYPIQKLAEAAGWDGIASTLGDVSKGMEFFTEMMKANRFEVDGAEQSTLNLSESIAGLQGQIDKLSAKPIQEVTSSLSGMGNFKESSVNLAVKPLNVLPQVSSTQLQSQPISVGVQTSSDQFKEEMNFLEQRMQGIGSTMSNLFDDAISGVVDGAGDMASAFQGFFSGLQKDLASAIAKFLVLKAVSGIFGVASGGATSLLGGFIGIPAFASGGIVTGPTLAMVGEGNEGEAILPLSKLSSLINSGGAGSMKVSGSFQLSGSVAQAVIDRNQYTKSR